VSGEYLILEDDPRAAVRRAAEVLGAGGLVVFPTDTVYGLLAAATDAAAYRRIYELKRRPAGQPLALLVAAGAPLDRLARELLAPFPPALQQFVAGSLTLIVDGGAVPAEALPVEVRRIQPGGVGVRTPVHDALQELLAALGGLAWATSANARDEAAAATAAELRHWLASLDHPPELAVASARPLAGRPSNLARLSGGRLHPLAR